MRASSHVDGSGTRPQRIRSRIARRGSSATPLDVAPPDADRERQRERRRRRRALFEDSTQLLRRGSARRGARHAVARRARRARARRERRVVLLGGDGSVHALANLAGHKPEVALLPAGRANNIAHSLGIPIALADAARVASKSPPARST